MSQEEIQVIRIDSGRTVCAVSRGFVTGLRVISASTSRAHFAYRKDNGSTLSISDEQSTVVNIPAGEITWLYNTLTSTGNLTLQAANGTSESLVVRGVNGSDVSNPLLVDVTTTYVVPLNKAVLLAEGNLVVSTDSSVEAFVGNTAQTITADTPLSVNTDSSLFTLPPSQNNITVTGQGKVIIFDIN